MRTWKKFHLVGVALAVWTPITWARNPKAPGAFGFELVVEDLGVGVSDILTVLSTPTAVPGAVVAPLFAVPLTLDVNGDGVFDIIKVNGAANSTTWQVPTAPKMTIATDPVLGTPVVHIPAFAPVFGTAVHVLADFSTLPPTIRGSFAAGLFEIPTEIIDDGAGRAYFVDSVAGAAAVVVEMTHGGGVAPALTAGAVLAGVDTELQDKMSLVGSTLQVAHSTGIDLFTVPSLVFLSTIPMPASPAGAYIPFTNMLSGLPLPNDMLVFCGQPGGGVGNTWVSWSSATGIAGPTGGVDPAGAALRPASGFTDAVFTPTVAGAGTVTALMDGLPLGTSAVGSVFQLPILAGAFLAPVLTGVGASPCGNPEAARTGALDPIGFQVSAAAADFFGAVHAGAVGAFSGLAAVTGFINPSDSPQPLNSSFPGFFTTDFTITTSIGASSINIFTVGAGPAILATTVFAAPGGATSFGTIWPAAATGGLLPVHFQQMAIAGALLQVGAPLSLLAPDLIGIAPAPIGPLIAVPAPQTTAASVSAAQTSLNITLPGVSGNWVTLHPSPGFAPGVPGIASIAIPTAYGAAGMAIYPGAGGFVTEWLSF